MLIVLANTKGGVGKSTLACHLAIWLYDHGQRVAFLDADKQGTSAEWIRNAEPGITIEVATEMDAITTARTKLLETHDFVVADTPGSEGEAAQTVTLLADFAIVPLQPTKPDVRALKEALKTIRLAQSMSGGKKPETVLVLNCVRKKSKRSRFLKNQLEKSGFRVAASDVRRLDAFAESCDSAVTRGAGPNPEGAAEDVDALFSELFGAMLRLTAVANG